jgi:large subunit ribosomal protein L21
MYAVIQTGGKQYRVEPGQTITVEKLPGEAGEPVEFAHVLLIAGDGDDAVTIGQPVVEGAKVTGEIAWQGRDKKITVYKAKRRKDYRRRYGHRQDYTAVKISDVVAP